MKKLFVVFLVLILSSYAWATDYTVCSSGCASATIQGIFTGQDLAPLDTVTVSAGTYTENLTWGANDNGDGTGVVTIQGADNNVIINGYIDLNSINYVELKNLQVNKSIFNQGTNTTLDNVRDNNGSVQKVGGLDVHITWAGGNYSYRDSVINVFTTYGYTTYIGLWQLQNFTSTMKADLVSYRAAGMDIGLVSPDNSNSEWRPLDQTNVSTRFPVGDDVEAIVTIGGYDCVVCNMAFTGGSTKYFQPQDGNDTVKICDDADCSTPNTGYANKDGFIVPESVFPESMRGQNWFIMSHEGSGEYEIKRNMKWTMDDLEYGTFDNSGGSIVGSQIIDYDEVRDGSDVMAATTGCVELMYQDAIDTFLSWGLTAPVTLGEIENGGYFTDGEYHPTFSELGFTGGYKDPVSTYVNYNHRNYSGDAYPWFSFNDNQSKAITPDSSVATAKSLIANVRAKNGIALYKNNWASGSSDTTALWTSILSWANTNGIFVGGPNFWRQRIWSGNVDRFTNMFPSFSHDLDADGAPDGYENVDADIAFTADAGQNGNMGMEISSDQGDTLFDIDSLYSIEPGYNRLCMTAKNGGDGNDTISVNLSRADSGYSETETFTLNGTSWVKVCADYDVDAIADMRNHDILVTVTLSAKNGTGLVVDDSIRLAPDWELTGTAGTISGCTITGNQTINSPVSVTRNIFRRGKIKI